MVRLTTALTSRRFSMEFPIIRLQSEDGVDRTASARGAINHYLGIVRFAERTEI